MSETPPPTESLSKRAAETVALQIEEGVVQDAILTSDWYRDAKKSVAAWAVLGATSVAAFIWRVLKDMDLILVVSIGGMLAALFAFLGLYGVMPRRFATVFTKRLRLDALSADGPRVPQASGGLSHSDGQEQSGLVPPSQPQPPEHTISAAEIRREIAAVAPLRQEGVTGKYSGHSVNWPCRVEALRVADAEQREVAMDCSTEDGSTVYVRAPFASWPWLRDIKEGEWLGVVGELTEIGADNIYRIKPTALVTRVAGRNSAPTPQNPGQQPLSISSVLLEQIEELKEAGEPTTLFHNPGKDDVQFLIGEKKYLVKAGAECRIPSKHVHYIAERGTNLALGPQPRTPGDSEFADGDVLDDFLSQTQTVDITRDTQIEITKPTIATVELQAAVLQAGTSGKPDAHGKLQQWDWFIQVKAYITPANGVTLVLPFHKCEASVEGLFDVRQSWSNIKAVNPLHRENPIATTADAIFKHPGLAYCQDSAITKPRTGKIPQRLNLTMILRDPSHGWIATVKTILPYSQERSSGDRHSWRLGDI